MRVPPNGPGGSVSFAGLHAIGALMIPAPRCRHPVCCLTGLGEFAPTCIATRRFGSYSRLHDDYRLLMVCGVQPITACWGCWQWRACASVRHVTQNNRPMRVLG